MKIFDWIGDKMFDVKNSTQVIANLRSLVDVYERDIKGYKTTIANLKAKFKTEKSESSQWQFSFHQERIKNNKLEQQVEELRRELMSARSLSGRMTTSGQEWRMKAELSTEAAKVAHDAYRQLYAEWSRMMDARFDDRKEWTILAWKNRDHVGPAGLFSRQGDGIIEIDQLQPGDVLIRARKPKETTDAQEANHDRSSDRPGDVDPTGPTEPGDQRDESDIQKAFLRRVYKNVTPSGDQSGEGGDEPAPA